MEKLVSVTPKQLAIYGFIADGTDRLKDIASWLDVSVTTVARHTDALKMKGLIRKKGQRFELTDNIPAQYIVCERCRGEGVVLEPTDPAQSQSTKQESR